MARTYDSAVSSEGTVPELPRSQVKLLNLPPCEAWHFMWRADRWFYVPRTGEVLPDLGKLKHTPGVGGVPGNRDLTAARINATKKGWNVLEWDVLGDPYIRKHRGKQGAIHLPKWVKPRQVGGTAVNVKPSPEQYEGYLQFLRDLLAAGIIPPPDASVLDGMVDVQAQRFERILGRVGDSHPQKVEREENKLAEMKENLEAAEAEQSSTPRLKGRPFKGHVITGERGAYQIDGKGKTHKTLKAARAAVDK